MVGVIVIALVAGAITAAVFAVIPWTQNEAAKQNLSAVITAEKIAKLPDPSRPARGKYLWKPAAGTHTEILDTLVSEELLPASDTIAVGTDPAGTCYIGVSRSRTDAVYWVDNTSPTVNDWAAKKTTPCGDALLAELVTSIPEFGAGDPFANLRSVEAKGAGIANWTDITVSENGDRMIAIRNPGNIYTSDDGGSSWTARTAPGSKNWQTVAADPTGQVGIAVVQSGSIFTTTDFGANWTEHTPAAGGFFSESNWTSSTVSADKQHMTASGAVTGIWASSDGGATWTTGGSSANHFDITVSENGDRMAAVANPGNITTSDDGGATWTARTAAGSRNWQTIGADPTGKVLVAAVQNGSFWTSDDFGATWTEHTPAAGGFTADSNWTGATVASDKQHMTVNGGTVGILSSSDAGVTWTTGGSSANHYDITISGDGDRLIAIANPGNITTSDDGGTTWTSRTAPGSRNWVTLAADPTGQVAVAAYQNGTIWTSDDYGATWTEHVAATSGYATGIWTAASVSPDKLHMTAAISGGRSYISEDGGASWAPYGSTTTWGENVAPTAGKIYAVTSTTSMRVSNDYGKTWSTVATSSPNALESVGASAGLYAIAASQKSFVITEDGGASWVNATAPWSADYPYSAPHVSVSADGSLTVVAINDDTTPGKKIHLSTDHGATWTVAPTGAGYNYAPVAVSETGTDVAIATNGFNLFSSDRGRTWRTGTKGRSWVAGAGADDGRVFAVQNSTGYMYSSSDYGRTFTARAVTATGVMGWSEVAADKSGDFVIVASQQSIATSSNGGVAWAPAVAAPWNGDYPYSAPFLTVSGDGSLIIAAVADDTATGKKIYLSADHGVSWTVAPTGAGYTYTNAASSSTGKYAAISTNGFNLVSSDFGKTWRAGTKGRTWSDSSVSDNGRVFGILNSTSYMYTSGDYGRTFTARPITATGVMGWSKIASDKSGDFVIIGSQQSIATSSDGGATWGAAVNAPWNGSYPYSEPFISVSADASLIVAAVADDVVGNRIMYTSTDRGVTWAAATTGNPATAMTAVGVSKNGKTIAVASNGYLYYSTDLGKTFGRAYEGTPYDISLSSDGKSSILIAGTNYPYRSVDGGRTWFEERNCASGTWITGATDGDRVVAATRTGLCIYDPTTKAWTSPAAPWTDAANATPQIDVAGTTVVAAVQNNVAASRGIWLSTDGGFTWSKTTAPAKIYAHVSLSPNGQKIIANSTGLDTVVASGDRGATWNASTSVTRNWMGSWASNNTLFAVAQDSGSKPTNMYTSSNGGLTWTVVAGVPANMWYSVAASADGQKVVASTIDKKMFLSKDGGQNWSEHTPGNNTIPWEQLSSSDDGTTMIGIRKGSSAGPLLIKYSAK